MNGILLAVTAFTLAIVPRIEATTWYAAANGTSTQGTYSNPWSVPYSVSKSNSLLKPGDTVVFKAGGTYTCNGYYSVVDGTNRLVFEVSGTTAAKITYKAEQLWGFSFNGGLVLPDTTSNVILYGLRIYSSDSANRNRYGNSIDGRPYTHPPGIEELGTGNEFLHNLIENTGHPGIASWSTTKGKYIAGNIIRFVGFNDYTSDPAIGMTTWGGANRGSGMYLQNLNNTSDALINGNIVYHNYEADLYAVSSTDVWRFKFNQNIVSPNIAGIEYDLRHGTPEGVLVNSNFMWGARGTSVLLGYPRTFGGGGTNVVISNNYLVSGNKNFEFMDGWKQLTVTNNTACHTWNPTKADTTVLGIWRLEDGTNPYGIPPNYNIDRNSYYVKQNNEPFMFNTYNDNLTFSQWKTRIGENNSTLTVGLPTSIVTKIFRPSKDPNFVHVAVFNWSQAATTTVDLSSYFSPGETLQIFDAQNIPTPYATVTYAGGALSLELNRTEKAAMLGTFSNPSFPWAGFDPRFRAFVIYRSSAGTTASRPIGPSSVQILGVTP